MFRYARVANRSSKQCEVGIGTDDEFYKSIGMDKVEVERAYNGEWYLEGYAPQQPQTEIIQREIDGLKKYLLETDYKIIKALENGSPPDEDIKIKRQEARDRISDLEVVMANIDIEAAPTDQEAAPTDQEAATINNIEENNNYDELPRLQNQARP